MNSSKKVLSVLLDILLVAVIAFAVFLLVTDKGTDINKNILYTIIVFAIPIGFYVTFMSFAGDKYSFDKLPDDFWQEEELQEEESLDEDNQAACEKACSESENAPTGEGD